jgi:hypothetical protein
MSELPRPRRGATACVAAALALSGCGLGGGSTPRAVRLTVTRDFGARVLTRPGAPKLRGQETVMSVLLRNYTVTTRFGGGFVQSVGGLEGGQEAGEPVDWFYYDNGVQAPKGAAATDVHPGDSIWWDRHDWSQTPDVPAVVGSFPEPFLHGLAGKRLPVRVECDSVAGAPCRTVIARLRAAGVPAAVAALGSVGGPLTLRAVVGGWRSIAGDAGAASLERGPGVSGVYARVAPDGRTLTPLDANGRALAALGPGTGLIAAVRRGEDAPVWLVTGTDAAGLQRAADAFGAPALRNRFAVAVDGAGVHPLPWPAP